VTTDPVGVSAGAGADLQPVVALSQTEEMRVDPICTNPDHKEVEHEAITCSDNLSLIDSRTDNVFWPVYESRAKQKRW
jgi:hypothetical protein